MIKRALVGLMLITCALVAALNAQAPAHVQLKPPTITVPTVENLPEMKFVDYSVIGAEGE